MPSTLSVGPRLCHVERSSVFGGGMGRENKRGGTKMAGDLSFETTDEKKQKK